ncbi:MAG: glycosyl hydrolase family 92 [Flavobacteriaceae bacterium CG2_30_34_30]|nr:glycoside hydrolase family 92 protein [Flavobacteriia bacterium]OIP49717.1 MAG: glycosyl hydrolase family 92 [Flavobacteriaceae bacterium CG2_30_34_30]
MHPYKFFLFIFFVLLISCDKQDEISNAKKDTSLVSYVNPFIGTGGTGHTFPGATLPFGMMQLSPDTRVDGSWEGCSGYHYSDRYIYGFSHTHLSGTGISDYGDVLLMPANEVIFNNGFNGKKGYRKSFSHDNETASPGYYSVLLDSINVKAELSVSKRSGMHRYQFPSNENQFLILDLEHRDHLLDHKIQKVNDFSISGYRHSKAWAEDQRLFYFMQFSHPIKNITYAFENTQSSKKNKFKGRKAAIEFDNPNNEPLLVKIGISAVDENGAKNNLLTEIGDKSFKSLQAEAEAIWEQQLKKIVIESEKTDYKTIFYTAMYHAMIAPNLYTDVDGRYRGMDLEIHNTNFDYYTVFSLWDTYRAAHPLYTIIEQERSNDFIKTFLAKYDEGGMLPIWDLAGNYTGCMIGYHAIPVITDAYQKGLRDYDVEKAFTAMKHSAMQDKLGLTDFKKLGFISVEAESESVSKTLEYAYDDWCIAQMAKDLNKVEDYKLFTERAQYYKNVFDPETRFMRGRFRNTWFAPFDPYEVNFNYTEANAWQYSFYVPQDVSGLINLLGGKTELEQFLDELFTAENKTSGRHQVDITGLIGQYAHGNEPSHHMAYLYNFVNKPHKTQEKVHQILTEQYFNAPSGISGNEDCGQMSAWYIFSSLGFYPVTPGSNQYIIGTPLFDKASINLENGKTFTIVAHQLSNTHIYIEKVALNGKNYPYSYINHQDIVNGGTLEFFMTEKPTEWGSKEAHVPKNEITEHLIVPVPFIAEGEIAFKSKTSVVLKNADPNAQIFYRLNDAEAKVYTEPFVISEPTLLTVYAEKDKKRSTEVNTRFYKIDPNLSITLANQYANQYNGGGNNGLIDGIYGTLDFRTGTWQGYQDTNLEATLNRGSKKPLSKISINFLQDQRSWIFYPTDVTVYVSENGVNFHLIETQSINAGMSSEQTTIKTFTFDLRGKPIQYIKVLAKNFGDLPKWHLGAPFGGKAWLFVDEIELK